MPPLNWCGYSFILFSGFSIPTSLNRSMDFFSASLWFNIKQFSFIAFLAFKGTQTPPALYKPNNASKAPFSSFYKIGYHFCLCSSPERFLKKQGNRIISQPIKGTIKRLYDEVLDREQKQNLLNSAKDCSENVMIVDLVRNDFSRFSWFSWFLLISGVHWDTLWSLWGTFGFPFGG